MNGLCFGDLDITLDRAPFLLQLTDGPDNELHILISRAVAGTLCEEDLADIEEEEIKAIIRGSTPINPDYGQVYEIIFDGYIIYQMRNESFSSHAPSEIRHGSYLIQFEASTLLEHLPTLTDACRFDDGGYYPGEWTHYGIYTQTHIIDVVSHRAPTIAPSVFVSEHIPFRKQIMERNKD